MKTYIITGGTGFVGKRLSRKILEQGHTLIYIGRDTEDKIFSERVRELFPEYRDQIQTSTTSLLDEKMLLEEFGNRKIDGIWHSAAKLNFKEKYREEVLNFNCMSTEILSRLAKQLNCPLYFLSTAAVHGTLHSGTVYENILPKETAAFNNAYEESKYLSENYLLKEQPCQFIIFRLAILIERHTEGEGLTGFYAMVDGIVKFKLKHMFMPFLVYKKAAINLLSVEDAVEVMTRLTEKTESLGSIFHITNPRPFLVSHVLQQIFKGLGIRILVIKTGYFVSRSYYKSFVRLSSVLPFLKPLKNKIKYYMHSLLTTVVYDQSHVHAVLGDTALDFIEHEKDFIKDLTVEHYSRKHANN